MRKKEIDPFDWENITIEKYYKIKDILDDETDDDITKNVKMVAVITDKDENEVWNMDMAEAGDYISKLQFLNKFELPKHPNMKIKLPNYDLVVIKDLSKINVAQYVDFQNFVKMQMKEGMEKILSIFLIPEGCSYNTGYDIIDLQKEIRENLSFRVAEGLLSFFIEKYGKLLIHSLIYCKKQVRKTKNPEMMEKLEKTEKEIQQKLDSLIRLIGSIR